MARKKEEVNTSILLSPSRHTWDLTVSCFTRATSSLSATRTAPSLHFTDHGIVPPNHRQDSTLYSSPSRMASPMAIGKFSLTDFQDLLRRQRRVTPTIVHADWRKDRMALSM